MRGIGWALSAVVTSGCGFQLTTNGAAGDDVDVDAAVDSPPSDDAPIDAPPIERKLYAVSETMLYTLDVDAKMATPVGTVMDTTAVRVGGLAFDGTNLIGLSSDGSELLTIDPSTAAVTARRAISPASTYYGLTVAPAGEAGPTAVVFAGAAGAKLVKIDPATGAATSIGDYGGGMYFYTDLAWVNGAGLFITLQGGSCNPRCFARLDHTTGAATPFRYNLSSMVYGLSGYRGMLWALHNTGPVMLVSQTDGIMSSIGFDPGIAWTEAAQ
ncbi:MAG: hypothetical protein AB7T06_43390 [Kofleriaceae bacterium]